MRRVISVYLPTWPTDRRHRLPGESGRAAPSRDRPFAVASLDGGRQVLLAVNDAAAAAALRPGMPLGHARVLVPGLAVAAADPIDDARALGRLAGWCLRYSPFVAPCPPDGIWIDATGVAPLFGGEAALLDDVVARLTQSGFAARVAIADTPGAAWAVSRHSGKGAAVVVSPGGSREALADLPLAALRLPAMTVEALRRVGFTRVGALFDVPRATITLRFGPGVGWRLDQALGLIFEPIDAVLPVEAKCRRLAFAEPIAEPDDFRRTIDRLTVDLCRDLAAADVGARRLDLFFTRVDGRIAAIHIGTARPSRDPCHLAQLLAGRIETIDPDLGVEMMTLLACQVEPLPSAQLDLPGAERRHPDDLAALVDRLANRLGPARVYSWAPVESDIPERAVRRRSPLSPEANVPWPKDLPRPVRLLTPPEAVEATALLPDHPPALFFWRSHRHRVRRADGPERIFGEWWRAPAEVGEVRDYFRVEDEAGGRFWLFRDGRLPEGTGRWYLHGIFG